MNNKNPLAPDMKMSEKYRAYLHDCDSAAMAQRADGTSVPLREVSVADVEFIGGMWRVQTRLAYRVDVIRKCPMVLGDKINLQEKNYFEFYRAALPPQYNCYGPIGGLVFDKVVAKYTTDRGVFWAYGDSVADARAFLGIKLYDEYMDLIHNFACKKKPRSL